MFSQFEEQAQKVLLMAKGEKEKLKHPYIGSEHLLLAILSNEDLELTEELKEYGITYNKFENEIIKSIGIGKKGNKWFLYTPLFKRIIQTAIYEAKDNDEKEVSVLRLFLSLLEEGDGVAIRILMVMNVDIEALYEAFSNKINNHIKNNTHKLLIDKYGTDLTSLAKQNEFDPIAGRDKELLKLQEILIRKTKNNPILIGEAGVGKTAIVEGLANKIVSHDVTKELQNKRIISLSMASLVAGTKYRGEFEERVNTMLNELTEVDDIILFIDEVHTLVGAGGAEGAIDASNILKPALARNKIKIIGATTNDEYTKYIEKDSALNRRFQKIEIKEPDYEETKEILLKIKDSYEKYHNIIIEQNLIDTIITLSNRYILDRKQPDKAIDLLDEACTKTIIKDTSNNKEIVREKNKLQEKIEAKNNALKAKDFALASLLRKQELSIKSTINKLELKSNKPKYLNKDNIISVLEEKTNIPINFYLNNKLLNKTIRGLKKKILGQDNIIDDLINETKIIHFNQDKVKAYLLIGSIGVGKTTLVEEYKDIFYKNNYLKINMNEYKDEASINKLLGSPPGYIGYNSNNYVFEVIRKNPRMLILIENIDKASPSIKKIIMQIIEDGKINNARGEVINFKNSVIFMTSTINVNQNSFGYITNNKEKDLTKYFSEEFLSKIDKVWLFNKLNLPIIKKIIYNKIKSIKEEFLEANIFIDNNIVKQIITDCNYKMYGASKIDKIINNIMINNIVEQMMEKKT